MDASCTWLSSGVWLSAGHIPLYVICCLEHRAFFWKHSSVCSWFWFSKATHLCMCLTGDKQYSGPHCKGHHWPVSPADGNQTGWRQLTTGGNQVCILLHFFKKKTKKTFHVGLFLDTIKVRCFKLCMIVTLLRSTFVGLSLMILTLFQGHRCVGNFNCKLCFFRFFFFHFSLDAVWLLHTLRNHVQY